LIKEIKKDKRQRKVRNEIDLCKSTAVCMGCPVLGLFNFKHCPTCPCRQKEKQKEYNFTIPNNKQNRK
jgi:hypothetical protein